MTFQQKWNLFACLFAALGGAIIGFAFGGFWLVPVGAILGFLLAASDNVKETTS